jgi:hypothetical protein
VPNAPQRLVRFPVVATCHHAMIASPSTESMAREFESASILVQGTVVRPKQFLLGLVRLGFRNPSPAFSTFFFFFSLLSVPEWWVSAAGVPFHAEMADAKTPC